MSDTVPEIEVVCSNCSFPTITEYDDQGRVSGFREGDGPKTEEEALAAGWTDSGLGLLCPACTERAARDLEADKAAEAVTGVGAVTPALQEVKKAVVATTYYGMLKSMHPEISDGTIHKFANVLRNFKDGMGLGRELTVEEFDALVKYYGPKDEAEAAEYLVVYETVKKALVKR